MYFLVSRLIQPFPWLVLLAGVLILLLRPKPPASNRLWRLTVLFYLLLVLDCMGPVARLTCGALETAYPRDPAVSRSCDVIIVLGGGFLISSDGPPILDDSSMRRCAKAVELYRQRPRPIIVCGGVVPLTPNVSVGEVMARFLQEVNIPKHEIIIENRSRTTSENATEAVKIMREHQWSNPAVVTSATHLPRSVRLFRNEGVEVVAVGAIYRMDQFGWGPLQWIPKATPAVANQEALHEIVGILWLMLTGR